jgi:membrane protease subunit (stomatin/prohibitin family)
MEQENKEKFKEELREEYDIITSRNSNICLDCGCILIPEGRCYYCSNCGDSKCS